MEIKFDPMTGEPIPSKGTDETEMRFDPMTGQPIQKEEKTAKPQEEMNFDPMTGQPIQKEEKTVEPQEEMNFDPMTGQPIQKTQPQMRFDPMTGQPVYGNAVPNQSVSVGKKTGKVFGKGFGIVAAIICVCIVAFAGIKSGAFLGKPQKVLLATANTVKDSSHLVKNLEGIKVLQSRSCTADVNVNFYDGEDRYKVDAVYASKPSEKQIYGSADLYGLPEIEFVTAINNKEVQAQVPLIGDDVYTYNYVDEKSGKLADLIGSKNVETIDEVCKTLYDGKQDKKQVKELAKTLYKQYKKLDFKSVGKDTFEVNGKDRKCKGYQATIDEDFMKDMVSSLENYLDDNMGDALDELGYYYGESPKEALDELQDELRDMPDVDLTFYIYKNKLACIQLECQREKIQIIFHGGKTRMQNMEVLDNDETIMELKGNVSGKVEESTLYDEDGDKVASLQYDYKTGDYTLDLEDDARYDGTLKNSRKGFEFTCDIEDFNVSVNLHKGAKLKKLSGNKIDIGEASERELERIGEMIENVLNDGNYEAW